MAAGCKQAPISVRSSTPLPLHICVSLNGIKHSASPILYQIFAQNNVV